MKKYFIDILTAIFCLLYFIGGTAINLNRFLQYDLGYYDFGIFDRAIWEISRFRPPIIDHFIVPGKWIFADHFNPSIFILTPLYWLTDNSVVLLIAECFFVALSGYVVYLIGKKLLKSSFASFSVVVAYFLYTGLQNAVYSDFHELTMMVFFLALAYLFLILEKKRLFFLLFIIVLGFKENLFLLGIGLSIFIFFYKKTWRKEAVGVFLISVIWFLLSIKIIIPFFSGSAYYYVPKLGLDLQTILLDLIYPLLKLKTVFWTFLSFLFLPLIAPETLPIIFLNFISRFLSEGSIRWDLGLHYNAELAPTLAVGTIIALKRIKEKFSINFLYLASLLLITTSFILYRFILHGPFGLTYNPAFYAHTKDFEFLDKMTAVVPTKANISAQNNLASKFIHSKNIWILTDNFKNHDPQYILIDARDGQSPSNYLGIKDIGLLLSKVKEDRGYIILYHDGDQYVFRKK